VSSQHHASKPRDETISRCRFRESISHEDWNEAFSRNANGVRVINGSPASAPTPLESPTLGPIPSEVVVFSEIDPMQLASGESMTLADEFAHRYTRQL